ncbi:MAG: protein phosphatase 2C domain-containing protein [Planctomycetota bacterium]|nr:protein phosphatase 2C domain-containing protein [Planctomycetota bacterium]MDA1140836.1 protein phosphatase 2C domain-containing protein [Planctomycetota bacterium]
MILSDDNPLGELVNLRNSEELLNMRVFPDILSKASGEGHLEILAASLEEDYLTLSDWSYSHRGEEGFYRKLAEVLQIVTRCLQQIHLAGYLYGFLTLERIRVNENANRVKLQWPLRPIRLGMKPYNLPAPDGYVCAEFASKELNSEPNWDLFSLGAITFQAISGESPDEDFSRPEIPLHNLRTRLPWLPAGWQGLIHRLLAKKPEQRFAKASEVTFTLSSFLDSEDHELTSVVAAAQHTGKTRAQHNPSNQDRAFFVGGKEGSSLKVERKGFEDFDSSEAFVSKGVALDTPFIAGVADGISSTADGAFAAESVMQSIISLCDKRSLGHQEQEGFVRSLYEAANRLLGHAIIEQARLPGQKEGWLQYHTSPGSTLCTLMMTKRSAVIANVGDSRVYLWRRGTLDQLTTDRNWLTSLLGQGLTMRAALMRKNTRELTNWVGRFENADHQEQIDPSNPIEITSFEDFTLLACQPQRGDVFCLCSDGLTKYVDNGQIDLSTVLSDSAPSEACRTLINQANELGGTDNIGIVIVAVDMA